MTSIDYSWLIGWDLPFSIAVVSFAAASFRAFSLRRAITVSIRRRQELGLGLVAASFGWICLEVVLIGGGSGLSGDLYFYFFLFVPALVLFYWADASLLTSRRADPLLRDTFHWSRLRTGFWILLAAANILYIIVQIVYYDILVQSSSATASGLLMLAAIAPGIFMPFVVAPVLIVAAWLRAKEPTIRQHLRWFAYGVLAIGLAVVPGTIPLFLLTGILLWPFGWIVAGYCLLRSARSLLVTSPLPSSAVEMGSQPAVSENLGVAMSLNNRQRPYHSEGPRA